MSKEKARPHIFPPKAAYPTPPFAEKDADQKQVWPETKDNLKEATKYDTDKPRYDLIPIEAVQSVPLSEYHNANVNAREGLHGTAVIGLGKDLLWLTDPDNPLPRADMGLAIPIYFAQSLAALELHEVNVAARVIDHGLPTVMYPNAMLRIAQVLAFGAKKYADRNWEEGINYSRIIAAAQRHVLEHLRGETFDPETDLPHLAHAATCLLFLVTYEHRDMGGVFNDVSPLPEEK